MSGTGADRPSAYADAGVRYVEAGYSAIPIIPGEKRPGQMVKNKWVGLRQWQKYGDRLPTQFELGFWSDWPGAGVGICLGAASGNLVALDFDYGDAEIMAALEAVIPPSPVRKKGQNGYTAFYHAPELPPSAKFLVDGKPVVEVLAQGRQTVVPPTVHPSGVEYAWLTADSLEDFEAADLPTLPADIGETFKEALKPFQTTPSTASPTSSMPLTASLPPARYDGDDTLWITINAVALNNMEAWVPALGLPKTRQKGPNHYEAIAVWRPSSTGRPTDERSPNLGFAVTGIRDFGQDLSYSPIDIVMAALAISLDSAVEWLSDRVLPRAPVIDLAPTPRLEGGSAPPVTVELSPAGGIQPLTEEQVEGVPGLVGDISRWMYDTSYRPAREFALFGALGYLAALFGRRYIGPYGYSPNIYMVTLAGSGYGKEHTLKCLKLLDDKAQSRVVGPEDFTSDSALEKLLQTQPSVLLPIDEMGYMLQGINAPHAGSWEKRASSFLLKIYSKADSLYTGKQRAQEDPLKIWMPCISIYGATTPDSFFEGLTEANLKDGLVSRLLVTHCKKRPPTRPGESLRDVPERIIQRVRSIITLQRTDLGNMGQTLPMIPDQDPQPQQVHWGEGSHDLFQTYVTWECEMMDRDPDLDGLINRTSQSIQKLAMIRAIGMDPLTPQIETGDLEWAHGIVMRSMNTIISTVAVSVSGSEFESSMNAVYRAIREAGPEGIARSVLMRKKGVSKLRPRDFDEIVKGLEQREMILSQHGTGEQGGRPGWRFWSLDHVGLDLANE